MAAPERLRQVSVLGQSFRVSLRQGTDPALVPLVLCNGIGASFEVLDPFVAALPETRTVVRFDVPGTGGSPTPTLPYTLASLGFSVSRLLQRLGIGRFDVLGMSWGGALAQQLALTHPRRCRRLVLVGTATGALMVPAGPAVLRRMLTPRRFSDPAYAERIAGEIYGGTVRHRSQQTADLIQRHLRLGSRRGYLFQLAAIGAWTSLPALPMLRQPTLVVAGTDDPIVPVANAWIMHRLIPDSRLVLHDDGHLALLTRAPWVAAHVTRFLDEADRPSDGA